MILYVGGRRRETNSMTSWVETRSSLMRRLIDRRNRTATDSPLGMDPPKLKENGKKNSSSLSVFPIGWEGKGGWRTNQI